MNFHDYLNRQNNEDTRAFIIHYAPRGGKTRFADQVCTARKDAARFDLLHYFSHQSGLPPIEQCGFDVLRKVLLALDLPQTVILVDNADFLFNTWSKDNREVFLGWLSIGLRSPGDTEKTFVFLLQSDPWFIPKTIKNSYGEERILALSEFSALE